MRNPRHYLRFDLWDAPAQWEQALSERQAAYADLSAALDELIESAAELGIFSLRTEATVRPHGQVGRSGWRKPSARRER